MRVAQHRTHRDPGVPRVAQKPAGRDLESTGQGTHLSDLRTAQGPLPPGNIGGRVRSLHGWAAPSSLLDLGVRLTRSALSSSALCANKSPA